MTETARPSPNAGEIAELVGRLQAFGARVVLLPNDSPGLDVIADLAELANDILDRAKDRITTLEAQLAEARADLAGLSDPAIVRVNILRGTIRIPKDLVWLHDESGPVAELRARAQAADAQRDAAVAKERDPDTVRVPLADYAALVAATEADDMIVRCQTCGAWLHRDDPATCASDDFTGCWKAASGSGLCRHERGEILELARLRSRSNGDAGG